MELLHHIREEIAASSHHRITFARYMELCLYHPRFGYYTGDRVKVGKEGDFYTSAVVHPVFAETLADTILEMWEKSRITSPALVEIGGGTGYLMKHLLERIRRVAPEMHRRLQLVLIESSPYHRQLQQAALSDFTGEKRWYESLADATQAETIEGVVFSNEWLDAFPVHILERREDGWREVWVTWDETQEMPQEVLAAELSPEIRRFLQEEAPPLRTGMRIEVNLGMKEAIRQLSALLARGYVITIDYGDEEAELYHPHRNRGTLMCYWRHHAHDNPYLHVGEQDITTHVNFTALQRWGLAAGLETVALMRQDQFLIQSGILEKLQEHRDADPFSSEAMKRNRAIRQLIAPGEMGAVFRVLVQAKQLPVDLPYRFLQKWEPFKQMS